MHSSKEEKKNERCSIFAQRKCLVRDNPTILKRVGEERTVLRTVLSKESNWIRRVLQRNRLLQKAVEKSLNVVEDFKNLPLKTYGEGWLEKHTNPE